MESKILTEIANGLDKDLKDVQVNVWGHEAGINACNFWRKVIKEEKVESDSLLLHYISLTRDFISVQNTSGYETLKSRGLELIEDDSLRSDIVSLYEYDYNNLRKLEEVYYGTQFQSNYFAEFNRVFSPFLVFDEKGNLKDLEQPVKVSAADRQLVLSFLANIQFNRQMVLRTYRNVEAKINSLNKTISDSFGDKH